MLDAEVSFDDLFDGYSALMDTATPGGNDEYEFRLLAAMTYLVSKWTSHATTPSASPFEREVFRQRCRAPQGSIVGQIINAKNRLQALRGHGRADAIHRCMQQLEATEQSIMVKVRRVMVRRNLLPVCTTTQDPHESTPIPLHMYAPAVPFVLRQ